MSHVKQRRPAERSRVSNREDAEPQDAAGVAVFGVGGLLLLWLVAGADRGSVAALGLLVAGVWMILSPARARLPRGVAPCVGVALIMSALAFLPHGCGKGVPWRIGLESLGLTSGSSIAPQARMALDAWLLQGLVALVALRLAVEGNPGMERPRRVGLVLAGLLLYVAASWAASAGWLPMKTAVFGLFPNRNHSATLMAVGTVLGTGLLMHGINRRHAAQATLGGVAAITFLGVTLFLNESRAGVVLTGLGLLALAALSMRHRRSVHARKALALLVLAGAVALMVVDGGVKKRLVETPVESLWEGGGAEGQSEGRLGIFADTARMITAQPLSGWGAGQFVDVFPQYRKESARPGGSTHLHPESSWLWLASEAGVPALLALGAGLTLVLRRSWKALRGAHQRTLGRALWVAGCLPLVHGLFDVPLHRESILWLGALLIGWGMPVARRPGRVRRLAWRITGGGVALVGALLLGQRWTPVSAAADRVLAESLQLYRIDQLRDAPPREGEEDLLETALSELEQAVHRRPMDSRLHGLRGMLALHFEERDTEAALSFARQRALDPSRSSLPFLQGVAWKSIDPNRTVNLWALALETARPAEVDRLYSRMVREARGDPTLRAFCLDRAAHAPERLEAAWRAWSREDRLAELEAFLREVQNLPNDSPISHEIWALQQE